MSPRAPQGNSSQYLGSSDVKPPVAMVQSPSPPGGGVQDPSPFWGGFQASSTSKGTANRQAAGIGMSTQQKIILTLAQEGHVSDRMSGWRVLRRMLCFLKCLSFPFALHLQCVQPSEKVNV